MMHPDHRGIEGWVLQSSSLPGSIRKSIRIARRRDGQAIGLAEFVFLEDDDKLVEILRQLFQLDLLLRWTKTEPAFGFPCMPLLNCRGYPCKVIFIQAFEKEIQGVGEQGQSAAQAYIGDDMGGIKPLVAP